MYLRYNEYRCTVGVDPKTMQCYILVRLASDMFYRGSAHQSDE